MLKYIGGGYYVVGIPKRDLTDEEVVKFGEDFLLRTGLYEREKRRRVQKPKEETNDKEIEE